MSNLEENENKINLIEELGKLDARREDLEDATEECEEQLEGVAENVGVWGKIVSKILGF